MIERIRLKIEEHLSPVKLEVKDESYKHEGHVGSKPGGETHFSVVIVSDKFIDKSRLEKHRIVHDALSEIMPDIHALSIKALTPEEATKG